MYSLLKVPFLYPFYGLLYLILQRPDLGLRALSALEESEGERGRSERGLSRSLTALTPSEQTLHPPQKKKKKVLALLQIINPFMWLSPSLVARSHSKFFHAVFGSATSTAAIPPLSADQRARLDAAVAAATAEARAASAAKAARARDPLGSLPSPSSSSSGRELLSWLRWAFLEPEGAACFPWYTRWLRRALVAPLSLAFPLAPRLLSIGDTRGVAVDALRPWLHSKGLRVSRRSGRGAPPIDDACFFKRRRAWECRSFGAVAAALGCVPLVSWLLAFAVTAGAALWAGDLEREGASRVLVPPPAAPPPAAPAPASSEAAAAAGGVGPLQQQAEKQAAAAAAAAPSASKQEL